MPTDRDDTGCLLKAAYAMLVVIGFASMGAGVWG